jgi:hypothetical protein
MATSDYIVPKTDSNLVLYSFIIAVSILTFNRLAKGKMPQWKMIEGGFVVYMFLALTYEVSPDLANAGAILVLVPIVLTLGPEVLHSINRVVK